MSKFLKFNITEPKEGDVKISYSQYAMYAKCPKHWELAYVRGLRTPQSSIHMTFGTSFHETLQTYLQTMFDTSIKEADQLDLSKMLQDKLHELYRIDVVDKGKPHYSTKHELMEFYNDGVEILNWIKRNRTKYFNKKGYELLGIELPIYYPVSEANPAVKMLGYIDLVIRDTDTNDIIIYDIKTSGNGWNKYQKADTIKTAQLLIYKEYFSKQYGYDVDRIDVKFFIVKRKLIEGSMYPQKRVQEFVPPSGKPSRNKVMKSIESFVNESFNLDGTHKDREFPAIGGKGLKNCKYCEFATDKEACPIEKRIKQ
jgi:hypothetical protein